MHEIDMVIVVQSGFNIQWKSHTAISYVGRIWYNEMTFGKPYSCSNVTRHSIVENRSPTSESIVG